MRYQRRQWQPTPALLPGESHGQRSLAGYSPQGCKELDRTEQLILLLYTTIQNYTKRKTIKGSQTIFNNQTTTTTTKTFR